MNAVAYIRVSSTKQLDGDGPDRQRITISNYENQQPNLHIINEFTDDISGTKDSADRPAFNQMLDYCQQENIHTILVEKSDRLSRDMMVGLTLIAQCAALNIDIIDCSTSNVMTKANDPTSRFVLQVVLAAAEFNKNTLVTNMNVARNRIRKHNGKCEGTKGYADHPEYQLWPQLSKRIQNLRNVGLSLKNIANTLNDEQWPTLRNGLWHPTTVKNVLDKIKRNDVLDKPNGDG